MGQAPNISKYGVNETIRLKQLMCKWHLVEETCQYYKSHDLFIGWNRTHGIEPRTCEYQGAVSLSVTSWISNGLLIMDRQAP